MSGPPDSAPAPRRIATPAWPVFAALAVLYAATRFLDLARQSPFVDELANWDKTLLGEDAAAHPLTTAVLGFFLSFDPHSLYLLRLPSAIVWGLATVVLAVALRRLAGRWPSAVGTGLFIASPIALNFSQDANHYHFVALGACLSVYAVECLGRRRPAWFEGIAAGCLAAPMFFGHPTAALTVAALPAAVLGGWAAGAGPGRVGPLRLGRIRLPLAVAAAAALAAVLAAMVSQALKTASPVRLSEGGFEFTAPYLLGIAADLSGRYQYLTPLDQAFGGLAIGTAAAGFLWAWRRRRGARPVVLLAAAALLIHLVILGAIPYAHFMYSRYFIGLVPLLVCGWAFAVRALLAHRAATTARAFWRGVNVAFLGGFALSSILYAMVYFTGEYQPYRPALTWLGANLGPNDRVATYKVYHSRATSFWLRHLAAPDSAEARLRHVPLEFDFGGAPAGVQQLRELAQETREAGGRLFLFHYLDGEEEPNPFGVWNSFIRDETSLVREFPSRAPSDLTPIRRAMWIREVQSAPDRDWFAGPKSGGEVSARFPARQARALPGPMGTRAFLDLGPGASATYRLRAPSAPGPIRFVVRGVFDASAAPENPHLAVAVGDAPPIRVWNLQKAARREGGEFTLQVALDPPPPAESLVSVSLVREGSTTLRGAFVAILAVALEPGRARDAGGGDALVRAGGDPAQRLSLDSSLGLKASQLPRAEFTIDPVRHGAAQHWLAWRVWPRGIPNAGLALRVEPAGSQPTRLMWRPEDRFTNLPAWQLARSPQGASRLAAAVDLFSPQPSDQPSVGPFEAGPVLLLRAE